MKIHIVTDERCTAYSQPGHPERPARVSKTVEKLKSQKDLEIVWAAPTPPKEEQLLRAHTAAHWKHLRESKEAFDGDTPNYPDIVAHALRSAGGALKALDLAKTGELAFSLLRPPGHHATKDRAMGFCYLNSVAIAAFEALQRGFKQVTVFDFDVHHGNGTEDIFLNQRQLAFVSVHQHPCYPGTGTADRSDNCFNFPVLPETPRLEYRRTLEKAFERAKLAKPELLIISAGFDAYRRDPIAQETLEIEDFWWMGELIRKSNIPAIHVLEGGYSTDLPELIFAYLKGLTNK